MRNQMPEVDLKRLQAELEPEEYSIARRIVARRGKNKGRLRASKPTVNNELDPQSGKAAYVWRMVAFMASPDPAHSCMPMTADWDLPVSNAYIGDTVDLTGKYAERRALMDEMDKLVDKIVATLPASEGALSWARGLGITR